MNIAFAILTFPITIFCNFLDNKYDIGDIGRKFSYYPRILNFIWSAWFGYFWLPCPLCGKNFGGHEWKESIITSKSTGKGTCPKCATKTLEINKKFIRD